MTCLGRAAPPPSNRARRGCLRFRSAHPVRS